MASLETLNVLQNSLLYKPVRGPTLLRCGLLDAVSKGFIYLDAESDCGHGCTFY
jgi:hypothetical protein